MTVRDASTSHLATISVVCLGLMLAEGLSASVSSPRLHRFSRSVLNGCRSLNSAYIGMSVPLHGHISLRYVTAYDTWYQAFPLAFSPRLRDTSRGWKGWERG